MSATGRGRGARWAVLSLLVVAGLLALGLWAVSATSEPTWAEGEGPDLAPEAMAQRFHVGAAPCTRYPPSQADAEVEALRETALALHTAGIDAQALGTLVGMTQRALDEREGAHHPREELDEYLAVMEEATSGLARGAFILGRSRIRARLQRALAVTVPEVNAAAWDALGPQRQAVLTARLREFPLHFQVSRLIVVLDELRRHEAQAVLDTAAQQLEAAHVRTGEWPEVLDLKDPWGRELGLERRGDGVRVMAMSRDGNWGEGGLERFVGDAGPALEEAVPTACPALPLERKVGRDQLLRFRAQPGQVLEARLAPDFAEGRTRGFRVFQLGGFARSLGLCDGDVVQELNGVRLDTPQAALTVAGAWRGWERFELTILRQDRVGRLVVAVE